MRDGREVHVGSRDRAVVEPWDAASAYRLENLVRVDDTGRVRWRARLPDNSGPDCFVAIISEGGRLLATTWSGYRIELDPQTGEHLRSAFAK